MAGVGRKPLFVVAIIVALALAAVTSVVGADYLFAFFDTSRTPSEFQGD